VQQAKKYIEENSKTCDICSDCAIFSEKNFTNEKILVPLLVWGPNNQIQGFRESIYIANALGRKLVAPPFFPNWNHVADGSPVIHPWNRIDTQLLSNNYDIVSPQKIVDLCGSSISQKFSSGIINHNPNRYTIFKKYLGLDTWSNAFSRFPEIETLSPEEENSPLSNAIDKNYLNSIYKSDEKCVVFEYPWNSIPAYDIFVQLKSQEMNEEYKKIVDIIKNTKRPAYIRRAAQKFKNEILAGRKFAAMHWRYDAKDWMKMKINNSERIHSLIERAEIDPKTFASSLESQLLKENISVVYFASPPAEIEFLNNLGSHFQKIEFFTGSSLEDFFKRKFNFCPDILRDSVENISLFEQEICFISDFFIESCFSSWSSNIVLERYAEGIKANLNNLEIVAKSFGENYEDSCFVQSFL